MSITIFSSKTCAPCRQMKMYLTHKGFSFEDRDIEDDNNKDELRKLTGMMMVPTVLVGGHVISGYNLQHLNRVLGIK